MRCETVAQAKHPLRRHGMTRDVPAEGTRIRVLYDWLMATPGRPVALKLNKTGDGRRLQSLQDYYGLDIRRIQNGNSRTGRASLYVVAGEWFGKVYVDYVAEHLASLERSVA